MDLRAIASGSDISIGRKAQYPAAGAVPADFSPLLGETCFGPGAREIYNVP